ncbi:methyl-accepting chemotaxis protein (MCP) signaling protein [Mycoplana dimorpha]|uniref:Methyl-accepting chemotaxis protein (MCP) signaling protein n=1 Tax=Mycoplana dimorpha TaxID=28320 RepID=A0A2T5B8W8_MYCDI|nr:methyl-accepting chemotaxis protein (MCP) signaling protein [Mycoplana dimorpha]
MKTIHRLMESIAAAAREQSLGISAVNAAVNQMDQDTQQNAAMVQENTAASSLLAAQAARLRGLLAQFRLPAHVPIASDAPETEDPAAGLSSLAVAGGLR